MELKCVPEAKKKSIEEIKASFTEMTNIKKLSKPKQKIMLNQFLDRIIVTGNKNEYKTHTQHT